MNNIALFGCGTGLELFWEMASAESKNAVTVIFDNMATTGNSDKIPVLRASYEACTGKDYSEFIITSRHFLDIYHQLQAYGIPEEKIQIFGGLLAY